MPTYACHHSGSPDIDAEERVPRFIAIAIDGLDEQGDCCLSLKHRLEVRIGECPVARSHLDEFVFWTGAEAGRY